MSQRLYSVELFEYNKHGYHMQAIPTNEKMVDVTGTPKGNIVYTTDDGGKIVVMSYSAVIIGQTILHRPMCLSVSNDNVIMVADEKS